MYPTRDLTGLTELKASMRSRIARRRVATIRQLEQVTRPLHWVDRAYAHWRKLGPLTRFAAGPVGAWLLQKLTRRHKVAGGLMRWGPMLWSLVKGFGAGRADRSAT